MCIDATFSRAQLDLIQCLLWGSLLALEIYFLLLVCVPCDVQGVSKGIWVVPLDLTRGLIGKS